MKRLYEKAGLFYLGKDVDGDRFETTDNMTLLKNKHFTTHAVIIGMTGSGKTGLGIALLEEAAIDNIPAIVIDPKGDMGNLCLTDSDFSVESFLPWVKEEAEAKGEDPEAYARKKAQMWKEGIEAWDQDGERVARFQKVEKRIYTPGSSAGIPVNLLGTLETPSPEIMQESDAFNAFLKSTVNSLLSLIGLESEGLDSPEYILLAKLLVGAWSRGEKVTLERLITQVITPPFEHIGVLPLESFFPSEKRFALASRFNALIASPSFSVWLQGEALDIERLLYDDEGKAKISIFSISHLNDDERMFFVTTLLNRYIAWMRRQSGTSRLRSILYMDEIYGFFPPTKNPPSKEPMMLLLKQARAFGTGVVLSTQNPVDLDYKGLSNIGTWFVGRLQTTQDIDRVIEGLSGSTQGPMDKKTIRRILADLPKRTFMLKSAHLPTVRLFTTRWVMSYLKGPMRASEIRTLMAVYKQIDTVPQKTIQNKKAFETSVRAIRRIDETIPQFYEPDITGSAEYLPVLGAKVTVHFVNQRKQIDERFEKTLFKELNAAMQTVSWDDAYEEPLDFENFPIKRPQEAHFAAVPECVAEDKRLRRTIKELKEHLYTAERLELWRCGNPKMESKPHETLSEFKVRLADVLEEKKEAALETLKERYAKKETRLLERLERARVRVAKEESEATSSLIETGIAILGAFFGRPTPTKIGRAVSKGGKILKERGEMSRAQAQVAKYEEELMLLEEEMERKIEEIAEKYDVESCKIDSFFIKPRKTDIDVKLCALVWRCQ